MAGFQYFTLVCTALVLSLAAQGCSEAKQGESASVDRNVRLNAEHPATGPAKAVATDPKIEPTVERDAPPATPPVEPPSMNDGPLAQANAEPEPQVLTADQKELVAGNTAFAFDLYARLSKQEGNLIFSPYSISTALAMTYAGARGETAEQMAKTLHFTLPQERLHPACAALIKNIDTTGKNRAYELLIANALWGQEGASIGTDYLELTRNYYGTSVRYVDFQRDREAARQKINRWVEEKTNDKIKQLLKPNDIKSNTKLVITNAVYFQSAWALPFTKENTKNAVFNVTPEKGTPIPMMQIRRAVFNYSADQNGQCLELLYKGNRLSMVIILPNNTDGLPNVEKSLTGLKLQELLAGMRPYSGSVLIPRFKTTSVFQLGPVLRDIGMMPPSKNGLDLSGIGQRFPLDSVVHQAFVNVDEKGTEAAAATAVPISSTVSPPFSFRADHPFLYLIRDRHTGTILFLGRVANPAN